jgi:hypothetical protein
MDRAWEDRKSAYALEWFKRIFPDYKPTDPQAGQTGNPPEVPGKRTKPRAKKDIKRLEVHEKAVITSPCPRCGTLHLAQIQGKIEATHVPPDPEGESRTEVTESVSRLDCICSGCKGRFFLFVKHLEGRAYAVEPSASMKFREPRDTVEAVDLRFDHEKKAWQKIVGDKIVGPLTLRASRKK